MNRARILLSSCLLFLPAVWACEGADTPRPGPGGSAVTEETRRGREGRLVMIGGGLRDDNTPVYQAVLDGRWGNGPLCVLPTASGAPENVMEGYVDAFDAVGGVGTALGILITADDPGAASRGDMADLLRGCSGFFFTGGVQERIVDVFLPAGTPTPAFHALWERHHAGAVIAGSSAGAAVLSDPMIGDGGSVGALRAGLRTSPDGEGVWLTRGLGFLKEGLVDQHFLARGRWARLAVAVLQSVRDPVGFGVDENTALVVEGDSAWVVGESGVVYLDGRVAAREAGGVGGYGVRMFLLGPGDGIHLPSGQVTWGAEKAPLPEGMDHYAGPQEDLFSPWVLPRVLLELALSPDPRVTLFQEGHFLEFRKEPGFRILAGEGSDSRDLPYGLHMGPFVLSLWGE